MLNTPSEGLILTPTEKHRLEQVETRLQSHLNNIRDAEKKELFFKEEARKAEAHHKYQEERSAELELQVSAKEGKLLELQAESQALTRSVEQSSEQLRLQGIEHDQKHRGLVGREQEVSTKEVLASARENSLNTKEKELKEQQLLVEKAKEAFKVAASHVVWSDRDIRMVK